MVEFKCISGSRASLFWAIVVRLSHLNKLPIRHIRSVLLGSQGRRDNTRKKPICVRYAHRCFYEKAHFVKGQRGGLSGEATRSAKAPWRCVSIRTLFEPIEGGSVLDGIRPGLRRCHLDLGLPWKEWWPYTNIRSRLRTERRTLGLSIGRLSRLTCWSYRYSSSWRRSPSGSLALTAAGIVERIVDLRCNP
jgi:hypothetical protein